VLTLSPFLPRSRCPPLLRTVRFPAPFISLDDRIARHLGQAALVLAADVARPTTRLSVVAFLPASLRLPCQNPLYSLFPLA